MRILVVGVSFKNKGAEAMALTVVRQCAALFQKPEITLASYAKIEDKAYGEHVLSSGETFKLIANDRSLDRPLRLFITFFLPYSLSRKFCLNNEYLKELSCADIIIDASGYALSSLRPLHRQIMYAFEIYAAKIFKKPFYVFTQSFGPYNSLLSHALARWALNHVRFISCRGRESREAVNQLGLRKDSRIMNASDMTYLFQVADDIAIGEVRHIKKRSKLLVGIVPNINLYKRTKGNGSANDYIKIIVELIKYIASELNATPIILCHEHYANQQDDEWMANIIRKQVKLDCDLDIISAEHSAEELKATIGILDFIVASRFHSIVAAISTETPFFAIGWSHKYHDLVNEVNLPLAALDGRKIKGSDVIERFSFLWNDRENIRKHLSSEIATLKHQAILPFMELKSDFQP